MTDEQIEFMVGRFLMWKLPPDFSPDAGISFDPVYNRGTAHEGRHQPTGTNLFGWKEALQMVRHMTDGLPVAESTIQLRIDASQVKQVEMIWRDVHRQIANLSRRGLLERR